MLRQVLFRVIINFAVVVVLACFVARGKMLVKLINVFLVMKDIILHHRIIATLEGAIRSVIGISARGFARCHGFSYY